MKNKTALVLPPESGRGHLQKEVIVNESFLINCNIWCDSNFKSYQLVELDHLILYQMPIFFPCIY